MEVWCKQKKTQALFRLNDAIDWNAQKPIEAKSARIKITLKNAFANLIGAEGIPFDVDDEVYLFADYKPLTRTYGFPSDEHLITVGLITESNANLSENKRNIDLTATDKTYVLLSRLVVGTYSKGKGFTAPDIIRNLILQYAKNEITTKNVAKRRKDGSLFPTIDYSVLWKPLYEVIAELSQVDYTGEDRNYVFYIDKNNDLHWYYPYQKPTLRLSQDIGPNDTTIPFAGNYLEYPPKGVIQIENEQIIYFERTSNAFLNCIRGAYGTSPASHSAGANITSQILKEGMNEIRSAKFERRNEDVVNFVIFNAGPTPAKSDLLWYYYHEATEEKEFRMVFKNWKDISAELKRRERAMPNWGNPENEYPSSYPWTTSWGVTVNNNSQYKAEFIKKQKEIGIARARLLCNKLAEPLWKGTVEMKGATFYSPGDLIIVVFPSLGLTENLRQPMRIEQITHTFTKDGWITTLDLKEDPSAYVV